MQIGHIVILVLLAYLVFMGILGAKNRRYGGSFHKNMTGGRSASLFLVAGMAMGGHIGSGFVVGGAEYGATYGIGGAWYGIGCAVSLVTSGLFLSRFICKNGYLSLSDYFYERYENNTALRFLTALANVLSITGVFAGQLLAGKAIFYAAGIDGTVGVIITAAIALLYSLLCGMRGAMAAATLQTTAIALGTFAAAVALFVNGGTAQLAVNLSPSYFSPMPFSAEQLAMITIPNIIATTIGQPNFQRSLAAKSEREAKWGAVLGGLILLPIAFIPVVIGMFGRSYYPDLPESAIFAQIAMEQLPTVLGAILLSVVICAVVTTCNSMLISLSAVVVHDMIQGIFFPSVSDKGCRRLNIGFTVLAVSFGSILAISMNQVIELLVLGCTFAVTGCLVPLAGGVFWKRGTAQGATAASALGMGLTLLNYLGVVAFPYANLFPLLPSAVVYILVSLCTKPTPKLADTADHQ